MITLQEIIYNIKNIGSGGIQSSDSWKKLSDRQLEFIVNYTRSILVKRDLDKGRSINPNLVQDLGCVPVKLVDSSECCDIKTDCYILRTVDPIPRQLELASRNTLEYIGTITKDKSFQLIPIARKRWMAYNKYTAKLPAAYYLNGYIYITNNTLLESINIRGIFADPRDVAKYNQCGSDTSCYDKAKDPYPIADWMIAPLTDMILKNEVNIASVLPLDTENDTQPSQSQSPVQQ
jgi:hypothetical protein